MKQVIGFAGRQRSGKTTICQHLRDTKNATIVTVANALKHLCCKLIDVDMDTLNEYKNDNGHLVKINMFQENNIAWTYILGQSLGFIGPDMDYSEFYAHYSEISDGNECGCFYSQDQKKNLSELCQIVKRYIEIEQTTVRDLLQFVGTEIIRHFNPDWHVERMIEAVNNAPTDLVVIDDIRFQNEYDAVIGLGGDVFFIIRPDLKQAISNHSCETSLVWNMFKPKNIILNMYPLEYLFNEFDYLLAFDFKFGNNSPILMCGAQQFTYNENIHFGEKDKCLDMDKEIITTYIMPNIDKSGAIVFSVTDDKLAKQIALRLYVHNRQIEGLTHTFVIWNPFIIENLKAWIN